MTEPKKPPSESAFRSCIIEDVRPWGKFRGFPHENAGSIKIITVNPGGTLSLQSHRRRSEFWIVLDDGLEMVLGDRTWRPQKNEEIFIPREIPHRLRNQGSSPARVMEIWLGDSDEEDIVRIEDQYGRD